MARIRTIKPEFFDDEKLASCSRDARLAFIGMISQSDDFGVVKGSDAWLRARIFPYDDVTNAKMRAWIEELEHIGIIRRFIADGEMYLAIRNWQRHQKIDRPSASRNPETPETLWNQRFDEPSTSTRRALDEPSTSQQRALGEPSLPDQDQDQDQGKDQKELCAAEASQPAPLDPASVSKPAASSDALFGEFWDAYPRKKSKAAAQKAWRRIAPDRCLVDSMLEAIAKQTTERDERIRVVGWAPDWKHPSTWLNAACWTDEILNSTQIRELADQRSTAPKSNGTTHGNNPHRNGAAPSAPPDRILKALRTLPDRDQRLAKARQYGVAEEFVP